MKINYKNIHCILLLALLLCLSACSSRFPEGHPSYQRGMIDDIEDIPQNLPYFAEKLDNNPLLSQSAQIQHMANFRRAFFSPWSKDKAHFSLNNFQNSLGSARGYNGTQAWTKHQWDSLKSNASAINYPNAQKKGITIRQTDLREMPTSATRFSKPTPIVARNPFDNFQYSALPPGMPLYINHISRDGMWVFVDSPRTSGWLPSNDIAYVQEDFVNTYSNKALAALIKDKVQLKHAGQAHMGTVLPISQKSGNNLALLLPTRDTRGYAQLTEISLSSQEAVPMPLPLRAQTIAKLGMVMMGQPYGWGGTNDYRDCSSTLHDLFTPFGIWLPRNSLSQYNTGTKISLKNLSLKEKESVILRSASPFLSFIWMPGHIGLYLGEYDGEPVMFHNIWGIRVDEEGLGDDRHVIGRAVVTSLEPGKELDNIYENQTLLNRIGGISTIKR